VPDTTIGNWTSTYLTKFLNDWLRRNPLPAQDQLTIKKLTVTGDLEVDGTFTALSEQATPSGAVMQFAGSVAPSGWLLADGSAVSRLKYASLFSVIGATYGAGDGSTTFNLPDLRQRVPVGAGTGFALGASGGEQTHTLTAAQIPGHTHSGTTGNDSPDHTHNVVVSNGGTGSLPNATLGASGSFNETSSGASVRHTHPFTTDGGTGGGGSHNNMQPYLVVNHIIKT
jgi:microcystin-dependent protein